VELKERKRVVGTFIQDMKEDRHHYNDVYPRVDYPRNPLVLNLPPMSIYPKYSTASTRED
jgi:hypothetical protein